MMQQIRMHRATTLAPNDQVQPEQGKFLILERFFHSTEQDAQGGMVLVYHVQAQVEAPDFYAQLGMCMPEHAHVDHVSDHLVAAFDTDMASYWGCDSALWCFVDAQGMQIHQHST